MGINLKENIKYLNKEETLGVLFLKGEKLDMNNFCGEKFKKMDKIKYTDHSGEEVLENPHHKGGSYEKRFVENAQGIIELMGYKNIRFYMPSSDSPMIICYDSRDENGNPKHVIICAPRINNY